MTFGGTLQLNVAAPSQSGNVNVQVLSYGSHSGMFSAISVNTTSSTACSLGAPTGNYGPASLVVAVPVTCGGNSGLSPGAIAGIVVGAVVGGIGVALTVVLILWLKQRHQNRLVLKSMAEHSAL